MPTKLATLVSVSLALAMSGCIEAAEFADTMDAEFAAWEESWEEDMDEWESGSRAEAEDCPEEETADREDANRTASNNTSTTHNGGHDDGSINQTTLDTAYPDAEPRFQNQIVGSEDSERNVRVDLFDEELRIGFVYHLHGSVEITVRDPLGLKIAQESFDGSKESREDNWVDIEDPLPGDYEIEIDIDGSGGYTIGVYTSD